MMLILLAGLQSRPLDVVEAARIDGANSWQIFRSMTLPHLRQYIELSGLLGAIYVVQNFDHVFTITSGGLGTANLPYFIYQTFYTAQDYGRASAAGVVVVIGTIIIATAALRTAFSLFKEDSMSTDTSRRTDPSTDTAGDGSGSRSAPLQIRHAKPPRSGILLSAAAWVIGFLFCPPGAVDDPHLVPQRERRREEPAGRLRPAVARRLPDASSTPARGRRCSTR